MMILTIQTHKIKEVKVIMNKMTKKINIIFRMCPLHLMRVNMRRKIANMQVSNKKKRQLRRKIDIQVNYYRSQASTTRKAQQAPK